MVTEHHLAQKVYSRAGHGGSGWDRCVVRPPTADPRRRLRRMRCEVSGSHASSVEIRRRTHCLIGQPALVLDRSRVHPYYGGRLMKRCFVLLLVASVSLCRRRPGCPDGTRALQRQRLVRLRRLRLHDPRRGDLRGRVHAEGAPCRRRAAAPVRQLRDPRDAHRQRAHPDHRPPGPLQGPQHHPRRGDDLPVRRDGGRSAVRHARRATATS